MDESLRALLNDGTRPRTVGERLDGVGRRIVTCHEWTSAVRDGLAPPLRHAERLAELFTGRFERYESGAAGADLAPVVPAVGEPRSPEASRAHTAWKTPARPAAAAPPGIPAPPQHDPTDGRSLPLDVRSRLRELAGPGADVVRVHDDAGADRVAVVHSADAVAVGADVYFRDGRFRPDEPAGFGLLAHEASHVSTTLETSGVERATEGGRAAEEATALHLERKARHTLAPPTLDPHTPARNGGVRNPSATAGHPLTAEAAAGPLPPGAVGPPMPGPGPAVWGSTAGPSTGGAASTPTTGAAPLTAAPMTAAVDRQLDSQPPFDVAALRRDLVADLVSRLRSEFERGA